MMVVKTEDLKTSLSRVMSYLKNIDGHRVAEVKYLSDMELLRVYARSDIAVIASMKAYGDNFKCVLDVEHTNKIVHQMSSEEVELVVEDGHICLTSGDIRAKLPVRDNVIPPLRYPEDGADVIVVPSLKALKMLSRWDWTGQFPYVFITPDNNGQAVFTAYYRGGLAAWRLPVGIGSSIQIPSKLIQSWTGDNLMVQVRSRTIHFVLDGIPTFEVVTGRKDVDVMPSPNTSLRAIPITESDGVSIERNVLLSVLKLAGSIAGDGSYVRFICEGQEGRVVLSSSFMEIENKFICDGYFEFSVYSGQLADAVNIMTDNYIYLFPHPVKDGILVFTGREDKSLIFLVGQARGEK